MGHIEKWFDPIYLQHHDLLLRTAYQRLHDPGLAEDVVQSTFLTLLIKHEELQGHPNIQGWLFKVLLYKIKNEQKRSHHRTEVPLSSDEEPAAPEPPLGLLAVLPPGLTEDERQILYLHLEVGLSHKEIAAQLRCSQTASRMRLFRAKRHCGSLLKGEGLGRRTEQKIF